jgi:hypothetical protein
LYIEKYTKNKLGVIRLYMSEGKTLKDNKDDVSGHIYIIHATLLNVLKIGKTMRDMKYLINRYCTAYGNMHIFMYKTTNRHDSEVKVHQLLSVHRYCLELFNANCIEEAKRVCMKISNSEPIDEIYVPRSALEYSNRKEKKSVYRTRMKEAKKAEYNRKLIEISPCNITSENINNVFNAEDISEERYNEIICDADKVNYNNFSIMRYKLRASYNWFAPKQLTEQFLRDYGDKTAQRIYRNLYDILQSNDHKTSLQNIKQHEKIYMSLNNLDEEFLPAQFLQHDVAINLLNICGFDNILDKKEIKREIILQNINNGKKYIEDNKNTIRVIFDGKRPPAKWDDLKSLLGYINGIMSVVYGCRIKAKSRLVNGKDLFVIHHSYLVSVFPIKETVDKPYIIPNHSYGNIIIE